MTLVADLNTKGLWLAEAPRKAGAHAIIIGVSDYPHLSGGSAPPADLAQDNGGLGQLEVSAKTAAKVFRWLEHAGEVAGAPVATCRLLLSPRPGESADIEYLTGGAFAPADFESVRKAIVDWGNDIFAGATEPGANVAFFFFSGHGTEHMASPALLAKDILNPHSPGGARKALSFLSLCQAVKTYGIDRALFFVDACRDVPVVARTLNIVGEEVVLPYAYPPRSHDALLCLQSTRAGGSAYQVPGDPATIFGQAVIEALDGPPPSYRPYDTTLVPWRLVFKELESHVKQKVRDLLARRAATLIQSVVPYGDPYDGDMLVAKKQGPLPSGAEADVPASTMAPTAPPPTAPTMAPRESVIAARYDKVMERFATGLDHVAIAAAVASRGVGFGSALADSQIMRGIFDHDAITDLWTRTLRILDVETEQPVTEVVCLAKGRSERVNKTVTAFVDLLVTPAQGRAVWIGAAGDNECPSFAVVIPRDVMVATPVRLDIAFEEEPTGLWAMTAMSARLHDQTGAPSDVRQVWAALWEVQKSEALSDLGYAGELTRERQLLENALSDKLQSPLAAAIAATVLIRCGALEQLHDWPRNLADWFPTMPDGAVLWAETLLRRGDVANSMNPRSRAAVSGETPLLREDATETRRLISEPVSDKARQYFSMLADRGPPLLASTLAMAVRQEKIFRCAVETQAVDYRAQQDLKDASEVVRRAATYAVCGGLFAAFESRVGQFSPHAVLGKRPRRAQAA
jgi:hypothetical protein